MKIEEVDHDEILELYQTLPWNDRVSWTLECEEGKGEEKRRKEEVEKERNEMGMKLNVHMVEFIQFKWVFGIYKKVLGSKVNGFIRKSMHQNGLTQT